MVDDSRGFRVLSISSSCMNSLMAIHMVDYIDIIISYEVEHLVHLLGTGLSEEQITRLENKLPDHFRPHDEELVKEIRRLLNLPKEAKERIR